MKEHLTKALAIFIPLFVIFIIVGLYYLIRDDFETKTVLIGETSETTGKIYDIKWIKGMRKPGQGKVQHVKYIYHIDGRNYTDSKVMGKSWGIQYIGNGVKIEYLTNDPESHNIIGVSEIAKPTGEIMFRAPSDAIGYQELIFNNDIFHYFEYGERGKLKLQIIGELSFINDSVLLLQDYALDGYDAFSQEMKLILSEDLYGNQSLTEMRTGRVFK
jgi:hypothetical protein